MTDTLAKIPLQIDAREPDWVFRLTSGVAARLVPLSVLLFVVAAVAYGALLSALSGNAPIPSVLVTVVVVVGVFVMHEAFHGLGFVIFGGQPKFGFMVRGGVPYAYATCPGHLFTRSQYLVIGALPLVVISLATLPLAAVPCAIYTLSTRPPVTKAKRLGWMRRGMFLVSE